MGVIINKSLHEFKRLLLYIKPEIVPYAVGLFGIGLLNSGISILTAQALKNVTNAAFSKSFSQLIQTGIIMLSMMFGLMIFMPIFYYYFQRSVHRTIVSLRLELMKNILYLTQTFLENRHSGDLVSRTNNDTQIIETFFSQNLLSIFSTVIMGIGSIIFMIKLNWKLSILFIGISILMATVNLIFVKPLRRFSNGIQLTRGNIVEKLIDLLNGFSIIKMFHIEQKISGNYKNINNDLTVRELKRINIHAFLDAVNYLLSMVSFIGLIILGLFMFMEKSIDFGSLTAFVLLQINVSQTFLQLSKHVPLLQTSLAGAARVFEIYDAEKENPYTIINNLPPSFPHEMVQFNHVFFNYIPNEPILEDISFTVYEGQITAFTGPSGSGKSTILKLLLGFYNPRKGSIKIAGKSISDYSLKDLRNLIAYVPQESYLFDNSIIENIRFGNINASNEEVYEAANVANAHDFIQKLPHKYETRVGETGSKLSGGQKQRIAIARAILKNAPILLLDEATSALDSESEYLIQQAIDSLACKKTIIVIAHRLSTIKNADRVNIVYQGKIVNNKQQ